jgi:glycosyltransferase involved in cell wall biosynthesis
MRLGVYSDMAYRQDALGRSTGQAFVRFLAALPPRVEEVVLLGRLDPAPGRAAYAIPEHGVRLVALPHYPRVRSLRAMAAALPRTRAAFAAELGRLDAVLVFGPHPVALALAHVARRDGTPLVLGVRQDYPEYIRHRLPGRAWGWAVPVARALDGAFRRLGREAPAVVLGDALARRYAGGAPVLCTGFSLVPEREVAAERDALARRWDGGLRVLSVGRLDREKNPLLLVEVLAALRAHSPRWRLTVAGDGPLAGELRTAFADSGLTDAVELLGEVANGPRLWAEYRRSDAFLHVSLTEGLPQVLFEAQAAGLPVVATAVGGVGEALGGGARGLLVPPGDAAAAAGALARLAGDAALRERLVRAGLAHARAETMERQLDRLAAFVRAAAADSAGPPAAPARAARSHRYRSKASERKSPATR